MAGLFDSENNVGQFGADDSNIIRYKQAAEYAEDARQFALQAAEAIVDADNLLNRAEEVLQEARDILANVQDVESQVEQLEARVAAAEAVANEAIAKAQQAIEDTAGIIAAAQGYADSAQSSANQALGFSQTAQSYASAAENSSVEAKGFRDEADGFADEAEQSVTDATAAATTANTQADRAKSEADRAAEIVAGIPGKETIDGFVKVYRNMSDANTDLSERTVGDKVLVWDNDTAIYSWYDITGTSDNKVLTLNSTERKLKTVNSVQPDDSGNVQITLPSGNPSLWLGETVFFQYDPDQPITYPGLLAQDGKEYNRADYPDLWNAVNLGYIPSVSEADWQSGKKNAFSTGNGTTTFRVPLFDGEAIRSPNASDTKGVITEQIPYVVSVNGVLPDDSTGNVSLDLSGYATNSSVNSAITAAVASKASSGANSDITSLTGLTTALTISQGGTGSNSQSGARSNLGLGSVSVESVVPVSKGGTGATTESAARTNLGLKGASVLDVGTTSGTVAAGNDTRFSTLEGKVGGNVTGTTTFSQINGVSGYPAYFNRTYLVNGVYFGGAIQFGYSSGANKLDDYSDMYIQYDGTIKSVFQRHLAPNGAVQAVFAYHSNGNYNAYNGNFIGISDERIKDDIVRIQDPLEKMKQIKGVTYKRKDTGKFGIGFIAQDVQAAFPDAVYSSNYDIILPNGNAIKDVLSPDTSNVSAALHHEAILALMEEINLLKTRIESLESGNSK